MKNQNPSLYPVHPVHPVNFSPAIQNKRESGKNENAQSGLDLSRRSARSVIEIN